MTATPKRKVLVIDDEQDMLTFLTALLEDGGYAVNVARDGEEALEALREAPPDLVTLDITMPPPSGVKVYRTLKSDPRLRGVPVIIITGISEDFRGFISSRGQVPPPEGYLSKPVDKQRLLELVGGLLGRS